MSDAGEKRLSTEELDGMLAPLRGMVKPGSVWRHRETLANVAAVSVALDEGTLAPVVLYEHGGILWVRNAQTFLRRFEPMPGEHSPHSVADEVAARVRTQERKGVSKYGALLSEQELLPSEVAEHLLQEVTDATAYLVDLKRRLKGMEL